MLIIPLLFLNIISIFIKQNFSSTVLISVTLLFISMFTMSFLCNYILVDMIKPGINFEIPIVPTWEIEELDDFNLKQLLLDATSVNVFSAAANNQLLPITLFSLIFGCALSQLKLDALNTIFLQLNTVLNKLLTWVMYFTPIGVLALSSDTTANVGVDLLVSALIYLLLAWFGCIFVIILMMLVVWVICKITPLQQLKKLHNLLIVAMSTCSSIATLPETIRTCTEEFNISTNVTMITAPLGCSINKCGEAISSSLLALFTAQLCDLPITNSLFFTMLFLSFIFNLNTPALPGGGLIFSSAYLNLLGLPNIFMSVYAGIYRLLDIIFTATNVIGDVVAALIVDRILYFNKYKV